MVSQTIKLSPKIVSIVWYKVLPAKFGGQKGIANFARSLGKHFPLTCLCSKDNLPGDDLSYKVLPQLPVGKKQFFNPFTRWHIIKTAKKEKATHILLEHPYHCVAAVKATKITGAKLIVHSHNIESERYRQLGKWWWRILYKYEKWVHRCADLNLFKTETDLQYAIDHFCLSPTKCMIMPYGVDHISIDKTKSRSLIIKRHALSPHDKLLLFAGTLDYEPNAKAIEAIYAKIAPHLPTHFKIIICGRNKISGFRYLNKLSHPSVINAGEIDDIEKYFAASDVFINPVQTGGGVQTKNIDALSYGLNVVCFDQMLSGIHIDLCPGKIFPVPKNDYLTFAQNISLATNSNDSYPPPEFFNYYSFDTQVEKLAPRLNSL